MALFNFHLQSPKFLSLISKLTSLIVILVGVNVIIGWIFDISVLKNISSDYFSMIVFIAIAFIGYYSYSTGKTTVYQQLVNNVTSLAHAKDQTIKQYLNTKKRRIQGFSTDGYMAAILKQINEEKGNFNSLSNSLTKH